MFKINEMYSFTFVLGGSERQMLLRVVEADGHLLKVREQMGGDEPMIINTASSSFVSALLIEDSTSDTFDPRTMIG